MIQLLTVRVAWPPIPRCSSGQGTFVRRPLYTELAAFPAYSCHGLQGSLSSIQQVATSGLDVFAHNVETVERLQGVVRDRRANWQQSLGVLSAAKDAGVQITKTSIMLGCGEHQDEVSEAHRSASLLGCRQLNRLERSLRPSGWAIFTAIAAGQYAKQALMQRGWGLW